MYKTTSPKDGSDVLETLVPGNKVKITSIPLLLLM